MALFMSYVNLRINVAILYGAIQIIEVHLYYNRMFNGRVRVITVSDLRDKIFAADDIQVEDLHIPEWDVKVQVRGMTSGERADYITQGRDDEGNVIFSKLQPMAAIICTYDPETGERVFTIDDFDALQGKSAQALERILEVAQRLSGMDRDAEKKAGEGSSTEKEGSTTN